MVIVVSILLIGTAVGLAYYWVDFYARGGVQARNEDWYMKFQKAFVPADLWTCVCAVLGAAGLLTGQTYGLLFALLAAGSLIFLASMDITFNVQNKLYSLLAASNQMKFEVFINVWTLALGIILIISLWPRIALI